MISVVVPEITLNVVEVEMLTGGILVVPSVLPERLPVTVGILDEAHDTVDSKVVVVPSITVVRVVTALLVLNGFREAICEDNLDSTVFVVPSITVVRVVTSLVGGRVVTVTPLEPNVEVADSLVVVREDATSAEALGDTIDDSGDNVSNSVIVFVVPSLTVQRVVLSYVTMVVVSGKLATVVKAPGCNDGIGADNVENVDSIVIVEPSKIIDMAVTSKVAVVRLP